MPPVRPPAARRALACLAVLAVLGVDACSAKHSTAAPAPSTSSDTVPATTATPSPSTTTSTAPTCPLTGLPGKPGRLLVVKVDNTVFAHPQAGITKADVVYVEEVEGGLTRLAVVFSCTPPKTVGPVRSARITDIDLLAQYGRPAFAYSGAQQKMLPVLAAAPSYDVSADRGARGYFRVSSHVAPENLFADVATLYAQAPKATVGHSVGFRFGAAPAGGTPVTQVTVRYPDAVVSFQWSGARWLVSMDGARAMATEGGQLGAPTVVVQYVSITASIYRDVLGHYTPLSTLTGTGTALVLRDGRAYPAAWSRPSRRSGTTFTVGGVPMPFSRGQVWVVLADRTKRASVS